MNIFADSALSLISTCAGANCVALLDQRTDNPFSPREDQMGKGKEMLVGWLVGKAGVDFGVAQALAASDAQAAEQLKRLEETLVARISELQKEKRLERNTRKLRARAERFTGRASRFCQAHESGRSGRATNGAVR
jgi:hypothetical protein